MKASDYSNVAIIYKKFYAQTENPESINGLLNLQKI